MPWWISLLAVLVFSVAVSAVSPATNTGFSPLLVSVKEVMAAKKSNPRTLLVDVRGEENFREIHIPDSINVVLHFIKTKIYLRSMSVVLVGDGYADGPLFKQAELLNEKGIKTVVLAGGLAAWSQQGGALMGSDSVGHSDLHNVNPASLSLTEFSRIIDVSSDKTVGDLPLFSKAEHIVVTSLDDVPDLAELIDMPNQSPLASVLIFNRNGDYGLIEGLPNKCQTTLFFLQEGSDGYSKAVAQQRAILEPKSERMKTIGGCPTCPPVKDYTGQESMHMSAGEIR